MFRDRRDAGKRLAELLQQYSHAPDGLVLALPRGGVPVAYEIATSLGLPLDVFEVRKLGAPGQPELAMGAVGSGGALYINEPLTEVLGISRERLLDLARAELGELERRDALYREGRAPIDPTGKTVIIVDDGIATGATMHAAVGALRRKKPARIVAAVPVGPESSRADLAEVADEVVFAMQPQSFFAVGSWYDDFRQVDDDEVRELLRTAARPESSE